MEKLKNFQIIDIIILKLIALGYSTNSEILKMLSRFFKTPISKQDLNYKLQCFYKKQLLVKIENLEDKNKTPQKKFYYILGVNCFNYINKHENFLKELIKNNEEINFEIADNVKAIEIYILFLLSENITARTVIIKRVKKIISVNEISFTKHFNNLVDKNLIYHSNDKTKGMTFSLTQQGRDYLKKELRLISRIVNYNI